MRFKFAKYYLDSTYQDGELVISTYDLKRGKEVIKRHRMRCDEPEDSYIMIGETKAFMEGDTHLRIVSTELTKNSDGSKKIVLLGDVEVGGHRNGTWMQVINV